jgi:hypothetical protein
MEHLPALRQPLEFLDKTDLCTPNELGLYLSDLYNMSYEMLHTMDDVPFTAQLIPTRFLIVASGWHMFEERYFHYSLNGNDPYQYELIMEAFESGLTEEDILESWSDFKNFNASYNVPFTDQDHEGAMIRDIVKLLDQFNFTYLMDDNENIYQLPEKIVVRDWVNPPFKQVW